MMEKGRARHGIKTGAGLVQNEELRFGGKSAGDEDALSFAL